MESSPHAQMVPHRPRGAGTLRLSKTPTQFSHEQNSTANRTCGRFSPSLSTQCACAIPWHIAGRIADRTSVKESQTTCGTRSRPPAGGTPTGSAGAEDSAQPQELISAAASAAQQPMPQSAGSFTNVIACAGQLCASSARMKTMERSRLINSNAQSHAHDI